MSLFRRFSTGTHSVRRTGSSALNLALVAAGGLDVCYATFMNPWDAAAGVVLVREAGGLVTDLRGATYDVYGEEILATNGRVHAESLGWIDESNPGRDPADAPRSRLTVRQGGSWRRVRRGVIVVGEGLWVIATRPWRLRNGNSPRRCDSLLEEAVRPLLLLTPRGDASCDHSSGCWPVASSPGGH